MSRYDPARDCFTNDPPPTPINTTAPSLPSPQEDPPSPTKHIASLSPPPASPFLSPSSSRQQQHHQVSLVPSATTTGSYSNNSEYSSPPPLPLKKQHPLTRISGQSPRNHYDRDENQNRRSDEQRPMGSIHSKQTAHDHSPIVPVSSQPSPSANHTRKRKVSSPQTETPQDQQQESHETHQNKRPNYGQPIPMTQSNLPKIRRRKSNSNSRRETQPRYRYHSPPPPIIPKLVEETISQPPSPTRKSSPPRKRKRPGAASRLSEREKDMTRQVLLKQEEEKQKSVSQHTEKVQELVRSHYNDKKELGKQWRQTSSKIKGLRGFNNWVKCTLIHKFSPNDNFNPKYPSSDPNDHLVVLDMGCGKGGDLLKWKNAPQEVGFYLGVDTADVSIAHAHDRYDSMFRDQQRAGGRDGRGGGGRYSSRPIFKAEFHAMDCWTHRIDEIPIAARIGFDGAIGPGPEGRMAARFSNGGGFDVVSMMFCMHYAFETETKCRTMLRNVAGSLKKGGRFIGTIPSSDVISDRVAGKDSRDALADDSEKGVQEWGNSIYRVKFAEAPPKSGVFRPPWGWKYNFFLEEAVEEVPEYVVPWEAFRGIAEDYNLELEYKKMFHDVWKEGKDDIDLGQLSERMGVKNRDGSFALGEDEWEACGMDYLPADFCPPILVE